MTASRCCCWVVSRMRQPPNEKGRPQAALSSELVATTRTSPADTGTLGRSTGRRYWARRMVDKAKGADIPTYGEATWLSLPDGDPVKVAAVVIAAECWAQDGDDIPGRLAVEMAASYAAHKEAEDAAYVAKAKAHRETAPKPVRASFMQRRAEQLAAAAARTGDYTGRAGS